MSRIVIFTDGASKGNPGPGGWGAIVANGARVYELGGGETNTTNNRMELKAVLEALKKVATLPAQGIDMYVDSKYVIQGATEWGSGWRRNGWITSTKKSVLNRDLWEPLLDVIDAVSGKISWHNVGGHIGIPGNERVDEIAELPPFVLISCHHDQSLLTQRRNSFFLGTFLAINHLGQIAGLIL